MNNPETRYQSMLAKIQEHGGRMTSHRLALLRLLAVSEGHPNATQLFEQLRTQFPTISLATVYKTLTLLKDQGEVLEIDLRDESRYDGNKPYPHPHLICNRCHEILDGDEIQALHNLDQKIAEKYGFRVERQHLIFYGLCPKCQKSDA